MADENENNTPLPVSAVEPAPILTDDEIATQEAAGGAPGTEYGDGYQTSGVSIDDAAMKGWFRANIRWVLAELDHIKTGATAEQREILNP